MERLGHVVVGTEVETTDSIVQIAAGGQDDDGNIALQPDRPKEIEAVRVGQPEIEDHEVRTDALDGLESRRRAADRDHREALVPETELHEVDDPWLVVDEHHDRQRPADVTDDVARHLHIEAWLRARYN